MPFPTREDAAADAIVRECGNRHDFPDTDPLTPTGTGVHPDGRTFNVRRIPCRRCGTVQVRSWTPPDTHASAQTILALSTHEPPEPGDVPGVVERAARLTDEEYAAHLAARGFPGGVPAGFPPDRRATAARETLDLVLRIRAGQLALLRPGRTLGDIIPVPARADSAGDLIDAADQAILFWPDVQDGDLRLTVVIDTADPGPDASYRRVAEVSRRFHGAVELREVAGRTVELPPLPAGYADYRFRFHSSGDRGLLQIWNHPRTRPRVLAP
ncbi:hypothetical protein [Actinomadura gamaensis]|uniref:Uncharacterized protein n=1 Tax=Actinomadura gamaensis TaxID=1763541 RepID=A0ABV9TZZ8_9ACTN